MDSKKIQSLLAELERELADGESIPEELAESASKVMGELSASLPDGEGHHGAIERLEEIAAGFEAGHPTIAATARQVAVALGRMGI